MTNQGSTGESLIRRLVIQIGKIIISGGLIVLLLRGIGGQRIISEILNANLMWMLSALILFTASHFMGSFQWWTLLKQENILIPWRKTISFYFTGLFFNNFLISSLGGDFFRMVDVGRFSKNGTGAVSTVFIDRFMGMLVLSGFTVAALPVMILLGKLPESVHIPLLILLLGWFLVILLLFNKKLAKPFAQLLKRIIPPRIWVRAREVYRKVYQFGRNRKFFLFIVMLSLAVQSTRILTHYLLALSVGVHVSLVSFFLIIPIVAMVASIPISVGGVGLREQSAVLLFAGIGLAKIDVVSFELLAYCVAIVSSIPGGLFFVFRKRVGSMKSTPVV
jgi:uncharacterized protein (TIRG00374 family)